jgi:hypothetical protein
VVDEASMIAGPDLADLIALAEAGGSKVILAGDTGQLQAVENGGGMSLLPSNPSENVTSTCGNSSHPWPASVAAHARTNRLHDR